MNNDLNIETMNVDVIWEEHPAPQALLNKTSDEIRTVVLKALEEELGKLDLNLTADIGSLNINLSSSPEDWKSALVEQLLESITSVIAKSDDAIEVPAPQTESLEMKTLVFFEQNLFSDEEAREFWSPLEFHWLEVPKQFYTFFASRAARDWVERLIHCASETFFKKLFASQKIHEKRIEYYLILKSSASNVRAFEEVVLAFFTDAKNDSLVLERLASNAVIMKELRASTLKRTLRAKDPEFNKKLFELEQQVTKNESNHEWHAQVSQVSSKELREFLLSIFTNGIHLKNTEKSLTAFLQQYPSVNLNDFWILFAEYLKDLRVLDKVLKELRFSNNINEVPQLEQFMQRLMGEQDVKLEYLDEVEQSDERIVENAGIVLLHPFFPTLFQGLGCMNDKSEWYSPEHQKAAIYLLNYVASGSFELEDGAWEIAALIVGYDQSEGIPDMTEEILQEMFEEEKLESELDDLLQAIRDNWRPMRNTSWSGLRRDFLVRRGALCPRDEMNYELNMEPHGLDVMLRFKDWGITPFTYSWMEGIIYVNWK